MNGGATSPTAAGGAVSRHTTGQRLIHWTVGISFVALFLSGLALAYPSAFWLNVFFGGPQMMRILHPWIGVVYGAGIFLMLLTWAKQMRIEPRDREWLGKVPAYARHETADIPPSGKFNGGQKMYFWASMLLAVLFVVTGIPLWFPASFGAALLTVMRLLHFIGAVGAGLLLLMHVYLSTLALPGTARGMITGRVPVWWARLHHPAWLRERGGPGATAPRE